MKGDLFFGVVPVFFDLFKASENVVGSIVTNC